MVLIGLGSNLGASSDVLVRAGARLRQFAQADFALSSLWLTSPIGCPPGSPDFVNAVAVFRPAPCYSPERLLTALKDMELAAGRLPNSRRNAPRALDLDLLVYGQQRRRTARLVLPHPRAFDRRFVLAPAAEVAPELRWPGTGQTVRQLLAALDNTEHAVRLEAG